MAGIERVNVAGSNNDGKGPYRTGARYIKDVAKYYSKNLGGWPGAAGTIAGGILDCKTGYCLVITNEYVSPAFTSAIVCTGTGSAGLEVFWLLLLSSRSPDASSFSRWLAPYLACMAKMWFASAKLWLHASLTTGISGLSITVR